MNVACLASQPSIFHYILEYYILLTTYTTHHTLHTTYLRSEFAQPNIFHFRPYIAAQWFVWETGIAGRRCPWHCQGQVHFSLERLYQMLCNAQSLVGHGVGIDEAREADRCPAHSSSYQFIRGVESLLCKNSSRSGVAFNSCMCKGNFADCALTLMRC